MLLEKHSQSETVTQAVNSAQETQERYRRLSAATFEGIVIHKKGTITDANQNCAACSAMMSTS